MNNCTHNEKVNNSMCTLFGAHLLSPCYVEGDPFEDQVQPLPVTSGVVVEGHSALLRPVGLRSATINNGSSLRGVRWRRRGQGKQGKALGVRWFKKTVLCSSL